MTGRSAALARTLLGRLGTLGVTDVVLAPGSRSGPLAVALHTAATAGRLRLHVRVDEREAGFLALGLATTERRPVPVVTTSGTAVANLHPALLEAMHRRTPVVAVTADRPARLRGTGANQTTDQRGIFPHVPFVESVKDLRLTDGPLHLNLEFDEPLITSDLLLPPSAKPERSGEHAAAGGDTREDESAASAEAEVGPPLALAPGPRTVVVAGDDARQGARRLAETAGWPLLAEPTSGSRAGGTALTAYRLLVEHLGDEIERVISFGHATLSRPVTRLLARTDLDVVHVGTQATFAAPAGPNVRFARSVEAAGTDDPAWLERWRAADRAATAAIAAVLPADGPHAVARAVHDAVPPGGLLIVGSSQPIRDLDLVAAPRAVGTRRLTIANRGLSGIDGVLSTAVGAALGRDSTRALAYVGDLTFLHGSNGLLIGPDEPRPDLTIVVANDDGGSIFASLEQGDPVYAGVFERVYATPTGADLGALCAGFGVPHRRVGAADLAAALAVPSTGIEVIEVAVDRGGRRRLETAVRVAVARALGTT